MLKNKVIIITGGAGLIGKEFAKAVIKNNGIAIIADIDEEASKSAKLELSNILKTSSIETCRMDITSKISINECINFINLKFGKIDALVNNAYPRNKNYGRHFFDVEFDDFSQNLSMNIGGYFLTSQQFAKYFYKQGYGNIINISSVYGVIAPRFEIYKNTSMTMPIEYAAIKSALIHITKYMSNYFKGRNIRVNSISPGGILDNQSTIFINKYKKNCLNKGMLNTEDLSGTLVYLLSDMSQYLNGQNILIDDGFSL